MLQLRLPAEPGPALVGVAEALRGPPARASPLESWRAAAAKHLKWDAREADLAYSVFEALMLPEAQPRGAPHMLDAEQRTLRFMLMLLMQWYTPPQIRRRSVTALDVGAIYPVGDALSLKEASQHAAAAAAGAARDSLDVSSSAGELDAHQLALQSKASEWAHRLEFVKSHLPLLVKLLCVVSEGFSGPSPELAGVPHAAAAAAADRRPRGSDLGQARIGATVPCKALDALGFLVAGARNDGSRLTRISDVFPAALVDRARAVVAVADVVAWLRTNLTVHEARSPQWSAAVTSLLGGPSSPGQANTSTNNININTTSGSLVEDSFSSAASTASSFTAMLGSGASSESIATGVGQVSEPLLVCGVNRKVGVCPPPLVPTAGDGSGGGAPRRPRNHIIVAGCKSTTLYVFEPSNFVHIVGCVDCAIVLAPTTSVCTVEHCERLTLTVALASQLARLRIINSLDVRCYMHTSSAPLVLGDCRGVTFAPHNTNYPGLFEQYAAVAGISASSLPKPAADAWRHPVAVGRAGVREWNGVSVLKPKDFYLDHVPAAFAVQAGALPTSEADRGSIVFPVPEEYARSLSERAASVSSVLGEVRESMQDAGPRVQEELDNTLETGFRDWLVASGQIRVVMRLLRGS